MKEQPSLPLDPATLQLLGVRVRERLGLHFPDDRLPDLERGLRGAARDFGFSGELALIDCAQWLLKEELTGQQIDTLAGHLTIGETYFFRDPAIFEVLRLHVLPSLVRQKSQRGERSLRLWCAACCTGEEPYSLAMMLFQAMPVLVPNWRDWQVTLLATDLNPQFLAKARAGIYSAWSFRDLARDEQRAFFKPTGDGRFEMRREIRDLVRFEQLNLVSSEYPAAINGTSHQDLIFCRNVLIYFTKPQAKLVANKLAACLSEGGYLVPSASEASPQIFSELHVEHHPGAILYRKASQDKSPAPRPRHAPPLVAKGHQVARQITTPKPQSVTLPNSRDEALSALENGDKVAALAWCERALSSGKMDGELHLLRAQLLEESDPLGAEFSLRRALYLEPDNPLVHLGLARLARGRGNVAAAKKSFNTALRILVAMDPAALVPGTRQTTAELAEAVAGILEGIDEE
jgi:chemotaxis protein methyltransferase CheR